MSWTARPARPEDIRQEKAVAILDEAEQVSLVHTVSKMLAGVSYVCNCCGCCCGICIERCWVGAMSLPDATAVVGTTRCIVCGLCVTGCPAEAVTLKRKAEEQIVPPPPNSPPGSASGCGTAEEADRSSTFSTRHMNMRRHLFAGEDKETIFPHLKLDYEQQTCSDLLKSQTGAAAKAERDSVEC